MDDCYFSTRKTAIILYNSGNRRSVLEELAQNCGLSLIAIDDSPNSNACLPIRSPDYVLTDLRSDPEQIEAALALITPYLNEYGTEVLVWVSTEQLDSVAALLPSSGCHILCEAQDFEAMPILTGAMKAMKIQGLKQDDISTDYRALHRISDELADFARTLARIADQDDLPADGLAERPVSFRAAPTALLNSFPLGSPTPPAGIEAEARLVRDILKWRRKRESHFDKNLFADPAWDILLDLYAAELEGQRVSVSSLCIAASVPPTTALRWISAMTEDGLLQRELDPTDARRVFIQLSERAKLSLKSYLTDMMAAGPLPI
jgi:DNA-binding MarR family transcriptional regulator